MSENEKVLFKILSHIYYYIQLQNVLLKLKNPSLKISFGSSINQQVCDNNITVFASTSLIMSSLSGFYKVDLTILI